MSSLKRFADPVYCLMRLIVGLLFACHGGQKILSFPGGHGGAQGLQLVGGWIELVGGFLIALGLFTRIAAFISSGEMAYAYFFMHASGAMAEKAGKPFTTSSPHYFPILNGGEGAVLYCWIFLFIFFYGAGLWSLDALIFKPRPAAVPVPA